MLLNANAPPEQERALVLEGVDQYTNHPDPEDHWLIEGIMPVYGRILLVGDAKIGKSVLCLQLAFSLACGMPFLGFDVPAPLNVVYLQYEMRRRVFKPRILKMRSSFPDQANKRLKFAMDWPDHITQMGYSYRDIPLESALNQLGEWPDVVVIDPLIYWLEGDENSNTEMRDFLLRLDKIADGNFGIIIVHHTHKPYRGQTKGQSQSRGASSLPGWTDGNLVFNRASTSPNKKRHRTLSFELRAGADLDEIEVEMDPEALIFHRVDSLGGEMTAPAILELCRSVDPDHAMSRRALAKEVSDRYNLPETKVRNTLDRSEWESTSRGGRPRRQEQAA